MIIDHLLDFTNKKHHIFCFVLFTFLVHIDNNTGINETNKIKIKAGLVGVKIAENISSEIRKAVEEGSVSFKINGTLLIPDKQSLNISEPERTCAAGQAYRDGFCGKSLKYKRHIII